jgi:hypothetical protein
MPTPAVKQILQFGFPVVEWPTLSAKMPLENPCEEMIKE